MLSLPQRIVAPALPAASAPPAAVAAGPDLADLRRDLFAESPRGGRSLHVLRVLEAKVHALALEADKLDRADIEKASRASP